MQAIAAFMVFVSSLRMSLGAEMSGVNKPVSQAEVENEIEVLVEKEARRSFCERVKKDWRIIKNAFGNSTFYRF